METKLLNPTDEAINLACSLIKKGEVVGVPTETVYGLAGDSTNSLAIKKIFGFFENFGHGTVNEDAPAPGEWVRKRE